MFKSLRPGLAVISTLTALAVGAPGRAAPARNASSIKAAGKSFLVQTANARIQVRRRSPEEIHLRGS